MLAEKFLQLLHKGGPELQTELLRQLLQDLQKTQQGLVKAAQLSDWQGISESTHVLLSLAGTVGAADVYEMAQGLNAQSTLHLGSDTPVPSLAALLHQTDVLIQSIADYSGANATTKSSQ